MKKIIRTLALIGIVGILAIYPTARADATWTYVGIQVDSAKRVSTNTDFCLVASTTMDVMEGSTSLNAVTTVDPTCADGTGNTKLFPALPTGVSGKQIWSNLVNLTNGQQYTLKIIAPLCFGFWHKNTGINNPYYCWYRGYQNGGTGLGESCNQICQDNGTTALNDGLYCNSQYDQGCAAASALFGTCGACWDGQNLNGRRYDTMCGNNSSGYAGQLCSSGDGSWSYVCPCNVSTGTYNFPFTFTTP